jgi:NAD(P)-dependent dehydrogenase (short-subunit alcohol dehydrogenase family)
MKQLESRVAVVTGAGSGIGRAISVLLAKQGCRVALVDIDQTGLDETQRQIAAAGSHATAHRTDVSDKARMQDLADQVAGHYGSVHILVNNAGVSVSGPFAEQSLEDFEWLMGINFWGVVYGCKFFLPHLLAASEGHVVNVSSLFGLIGVGQQSSYCASKFAVRGFSESLRAELADSRVGLTSVHPGGIATNIAASTRVSGDEKTRARHSRAIERFKQMMPPEKAAEAIIDGIKRNRARVLITRETHVLDFLKRVAPNGSNALLEWGWKRTQS